MTTQQTISTEQNPTIAALTRDMLQAPARIYSDPILDGDVLVQWRSRELQRIRFGYRYHRVVTVCLRESGKLGWVKVELLGGESLTVYPSGAVVDGTNYEVIPSRKSDVAELAAIGEWRELARRFGLRAMQLAFK